MKNFATSREKKIDRRMDNPNPREAGKKREKAKAGCAGLGGWKEKEKVSWSLKV